MFPFLFRRASVAAALSLVIWQWWNWVFLCIIQWKFIVVTPEKIVLCPT